MGPESTSVEEFMEQAGMAHERPTEEKSSRKSSKRSLVGGSINNPQVQPEGLTSEKIKLMKVLTITRKPGDRIAEFRLTNRDGEVYDVEIDEATVRAMAALFD